MLDNEFEELYCNCKNAVQRYVFYKVPTKHDGEDVLQETLFIAYQKFSQLRDKNKFKPWLLSIATNVCNSYYRSKLNVIEIPLEDVYSYEIISSKNGRTINETVNETLDSLKSADKQILFLFYIWGLNQMDISQKLQIPIGTVKSRLFSAKQNFKVKYPYPPKLKGENIMNDKNFPEIMPDIKISKSKRDIPNVNFEELPGWFIIPRIGEKISWSMYDYPERKLNEVSDCKVIGKAEIHGVQCVEINCGNRTLYARLTDTHCQYIADIHFHNDVKVMTSFLDDDWLKNWSYGEDNCGREILLNKENPMVEGVYDVKTGKKSYETLKVIDKTADGIYSETYIDQNGRTVLWRRYNRNDWNVGTNSYYKNLWCDKLPKNEKLIIEGETYVHWYDCITEYVL